MNPSDIARERLQHSLGEPLFLAHWHDAVFLHFAVPPEVLQPLVPFPLDLHEGMAFVSCVAFTMKNMRPRCGGALTAWPFKPIATHDFLNVRTYVKRGSEPGIYFLAEWLPNRLACALGPTVFGLPYRHGHTRYRNADAAKVCGSVQDARSGLGLIYETDCTASEAEPIDRSLTDFLLERYTAFTSFHGLHRCFRVWHPPWQAKAIRVRLSDHSLLRLTGAWAEHARFIGAHQAQGFDDVWMGRPRFLNFNPTAKPKP
jgi:uncharacterized protein